MVLGVRRNMMVNISLFENKATYSVLWVLVSRTLSEHDIVCQTPRALVAGMCTCACTNILPCFVQFESTVVRLCV